MAKKIITSKVFRALLPLIMAAAFGWFSIRMAGDRYFPFLFSVCAGLYAGVLLGKVLGDWE
jgi:hypothetical protein